MITKEHIGRVLFCEEDYESCWKPEELLSGVLILLHYHSLSSIAMSQGVTHHRESANYTSFYTANSPNLGGKMGRISPSLSPL